MTLLDKVRLTDKQKRLVRLAGYPALGLLTFLFAAHLTFPYERVKDKLFVEPLSKKYDVTVTSVERTFWPGGMILHGVGLRTRPTQPDEKVTTLFFDEIRIDLGLWGMIRGRADIDVVATLGGGSIRGNLAASKSSFRVSFTTSGLPLANIPGVQGAVGLPMKGGLNARINLDLPGNQWDRARGKIVLSCPGCTIGDGKAKIKPRAAPGRRVNPNMAVFAGEGMTVPELNLGNLSGTVLIADGRGTIQDFKTVSPDGEMELDAVIRFGRSFKDARFETGCMKFKLSDELKQREPSFGNLPEFMNMSPQNDGYSNVKLKGTLALMRWVPSKSCDAGEPSSEDRVGSRRQPGRPTIPSRPDLTEGEGAPGMPGPEPGMPPTGQGMPPEGAPPITPEMPPPADTAMPPDGMKMPEPGASGPPMAPEPRGDDVKPMPPEEAARPPEGMAPDGTPKEDREGEGHRGEGQADEPHPPADGEGEQR